MCKLKYYICIKKILFVQKSKLVEKGNVQAYELSVEWDF